MTQRWSKTKEDTKTVLAYILQQAFPIDQGENHRLVEVKITENESF